MCIWWVTIGRLQYHCLLHMPTAEDIAAILILRLNKLRTVVSEEEVRVLSESLHALGASCADVDALVHRSVLVYVRENMQHRVTQTQFDMSASMDAHSSTSTAGYTIPFNYVLLAKQELWSHV